MFEKILLVLLSVIIGFIIGVSCSLKAVEDTRFSKSVLRACVKGNLSTEECLK